jgi:hypothetical protein
VAGTRTVFLPVPRLSPIIIPPLLQVSSRIIWHVRGSVAHSHPTVTRSV